MRKFFSFLLAFALMLTPVFSTADGLEDVTEPLDNIANEPIDAVSSPIASVDVEVMTISPEGQLVPTGEVRTYEYIPAEFDSLGRIVPVNASAYSLTSVDGTRFVNDIVINGKTYQAAYEIEYLDTPKTPDGVLAYFSISDIPADPRNYLDSEFDRAYPNAVRLSSATYSYNGHAYAWFGTTSYWVGDPSKFYEDGSYDEVSDPQPGDIIGYFDSNGNISHSGVVSSVSGGITVTSKWGGGGLYRHSIFDCPYSGSVKYFRLHHDHVYSSYTNLGVSSGHSCTCDFCGESTTEAHSWLAISNGYRCGKCNAFTAYLPGIINSIPEDILEKMKEYEGLSEYAFAVDDNMIFCYVDGTCYFVEGNDEAAALAQVKNSAAELQGEEDLTS